GLAREPRRGRLARAPPVLTRGQRRAELAQRRGDPGQRLHLSRVPARVPARPDPLSRLPPLHPDAAQDARVPRPRGAGAQSAAPPSAPWTRWTSSRPPTATSRSPPPAWRPAGTA